MLGDIDFNKDPVEEKSAQRLGSIAKIPIDHIEINPFQPRVDFNPEMLEQLSQSISVHGVVQPITLRKLGTGKYQLISGERRLRASKLAGLTEIPAYIREANDQEMLEIALIENIQREDLNAMEISLNYQRLMDECDLIQEELAERVGKDRATVANYLRLLKLAPDIQAGLKAKKIAMGHARAIASLEKVDLQLFAYKETVSKKLSVRKVEELVKGLKKGKRKSAKSSDGKLPLAYQNLQDQLSSHFGTKVQVKRKSAGKGEITIQYFSDEDLNRVLEIIDAE